MSVSRDAFNLIYGAGQASQQETIDLLKRENKILKETNDFIIECNEVLRETNDLLTENNSERDILAEIQHLRIKQLKEDSRAARDFSRNLLALTVIFLIGFILMAASTVHYKNALEEKTITRSQEQIEKYDWLTPLKNPDFGKKN